MVESKESSRELGRLAEAHVHLRDAVENGLAVFVLADLQERRIDARFDEIAGRVDLEEPRAFGCRSGRQR